MKQLYRYWITIFSIIIIFIFIVFGFRGIDESTRQQQRESLEKALNRGVLQCYAQEGRYPESLDYLVQNYHIIYDEEAFEIKYQTVASNIVPDVTIIEK